MLIGAVTILLIAVFLTAQCLCAESPPLASAWAACSVWHWAPAGFGTYLHSPIPLTLAWGWVGLGTVKGLLWHHTRCAHPRGNHA